MDGVSALPRLVRSSVTTAIVLALAAGAHVMGGASLPAPLIVAVLGSATLMVVTVIAKKTLSLPALLLLLSLGQWLLHHAFSLTSTTTACAAAPARHYAVQAVTCLPGGAHAHSTAAHADVRMLALHAVAVVVTGFMLHRAEAALRLTAGWLAPLLRLPDVVAVVVPAPRIPVLSAAPIRRSVRAFRDVPPLRGPPAMFRPSVSPAR